MLQRNLQSKGFGYQILTFSMLAIAGIFLSTFFAFILAPLIGKMSFMDFGLSKNYTDPNYMNAFIVIQTLYTICFFALPAIVFSYMMNKNKETYLQINKPKVAINYLYALLAVFSSLLFVALLGQWNLKIPFTKGIVELEATASEMTKAILNFTSVSKLIITLLYIAIIPAMAEEFFFRGALQNILSKAFGNKNIHIAIFITSILFALMHGQLQSALPRVFLGMVLGYIYYYSGSIWPGVLAHAFNNGLQVFVSYLHNKNLIQFDPNADTSVPVWQGLISLIICVLFIVLLKKNYVEKTNLLEEEAQFDFTENNKIN
jgi:uncharacterized protein